MQNILFVCTGNTCRSVMAEGLFRKLMEGREHEFSVSSAGVHAAEGFQPTRETLQVMKKEGIDVSNHHSRRLTVKMIEDSDKIFVMEDVHREYVLDLDPSAENKVFLITDFYQEKSDDNGPQGGIQDPIRMSEDFYERTKNILKKCVSNILEEL